jgi:hypothetical protein
LPSQFVLRRQSFLGNTPDVRVWTYVGPAEEPLSVRMVGVPTGFTLEETRGVGDQFGRWRTVGRWEGPSPTFNGICTLRVDLADGRSEGRLVQTIAGCVHASPDM